MSISESELSLSESEAGDGTAGAAGAVSTGAVHAVSTGAVHAVSTGVVHASGAVSTAVHAIRGAAVPAVRSAAGVLLAASECIGHRVELAGEYLRTGQTSGFLPTRSGCLAESKIAVK